jgi:hypothetical protein
LRSPSLTCKTARRPAFLTVPITVKYVCGEPTGAAIGTDL